MPSKAFSPSSPTGASNVGVFRSVAELQVAIDLFIAETNSDPKPFVWIATPSRILAAVKRGKQTLESLHSRRSVTRPKS